MLQSCLRPVHFFVISIMARYSIFNSKLDNFITKNPKHPVLSKHLVLIFDECHRSQFGDMHIKIAKFFKNYHIFGFTGTPIFAKNAKSGGNPNLRTTEQAFGDKLHTYYEDISDYEEDFEHEAEKIDSMNDDLIEEENAIREFLEISNKFGKK